MRELSKREINKVIEYICGNLDSSKIELIEYIIDNIEEICLTCRIEITLLEEKLLNRSSSSYQNLTAALYLRTSYLNNVYIEYDIPVHYVGFINAKLNSDKNKYMDKLESILEAQLENRKGYIYQKIVVEFIKDCGVEITEMPLSNDGGIDIVGIEKISILKNTVSCKIHIRGQVKCHSNVIGKGELIKLVKDEIYFSMNVSDRGLNNKRQLIFVSHNGYSIQAREYAENCDIILLDSERIIESALQLQKSRALTEIEKLHDYLSNNTHVKLEEINW